jgi:RNA polymerase sigma factor (sigma-70 family)
MISLGPEEIDETTVARAQKGDPRALDQVVRALMPYLGRVCGAIALDNGEDALQETLWAVIRNIGSLREPTSLRPWARRIAVREALRHTAAKSVPLDSESMAAVDFAVSPETALEVRETLRALSPDQRVVLVLQHFDGLNEKEIANVLGVRVGTVKSRLNRARAEFRTRWNP